ncbi:ABC transporter permease [Candidatus Hydrogenedentota bacterium]
MLLTIIKKEFLNHVLSFRFSVFFVLVFLLSVVSMVVMSSRYNRDVEAYNLGCRERDTVLAELPHARFLRLVTTSSRKPPNSLSFFSTGLEPIMSQPVRLTYGGGTSMAVPIATNPVFSLFTAPDLLFVVNIVVSLIALLFTFDAICGESEHGTLKLSLSNPVSRDKLIVGKWIAGYVSLICPFLLAVLLGMVVILLSTSVDFSGEDRVRIGLFVLFCLTYISVFFNLGLLVSASVRKSSTALMITLFLWVMVVLAIPNMSPIVARLIKEGPSAGELAERLIKAEHDAWDRYDIEEKKLGDDYEARDKLWEETRAGIRRERNRLLDKYSDEAEPQVDVAIGISRISASANFVYAATTLTRTGLTDFKNLAIYLHEFESDFREAVDEIIKTSEKASKMSVTEALKKDHREPVFDVKKVPYFMFKGVPLDKAIYHTLPNFVVLFIFNVFFFLGTYLQFMRYKVH